MDTVADFITIIRNAGNAGKLDCNAQWSKLRQSIVEILKNEGFIADFKVADDAKGFKRVYIRLKSWKGKPVIAGIERKSRPGCRVYKPVGEIPRVLSGMGVAVLSTSRGVMSDKDARKNNIGGELLFTVW